MKHEIKHKGNPRHKRTYPSKSGRIAIQITLKEHIANTLKETAEKEGKYISYMTDAAFAMYLGIPVNEGQVSEFMPINIPADLNSELAAIASRTGISIEQLASTAIKQYIESLNKVLPVAS